MNERRPLPRRCSILPQGSHRIVERVRNRVGVDDRAVEQPFVELPCYKRTVRVVHRPDFAESRPRHGVSWDSPHRRDDALEAGEQHRRCEVHGFVRVLMVALGCLACAKIGEEGILEIQLHQL
jgi:hypothetical protein